MRTGLFCVLLCWFMPAFAATPSLSELAETSRWQALLHICLLYTSDAADE